MAKNTNYAILGVLTIEPQTGYDIKKFIEKSIGNFWQESYGQLYPALKDLVEAGMAEMHIEHNVDGKPDKKVYSITGKGRDELKDWLTQPVKKMPVLRNEVLLKLFFGYEVDDQISIKHIEDVKNRASESLQHLQSINKIIESDFSDHPGNRFWKITVLAGLHNFQSMLNWAEESIKLLSGDNK
jgi:DNA-binding PadR family transcriptional regulator